MGYRLVELLVLDSVWSSFIFVGNVFVGKSRIIIMYVIKIVIMMLKLSIVYVDIKIRYLIF